jgi:hypothetical protein
MVDEATDANNARNPKKKRGRPKLATTFYKTFVSILHKRNQVDMIESFRRGCRDEELSRELLALADAKKTTATVLAYVARFPADQQRTAFEMLNKLGSRAAKRYVECHTSPPSPQQMEERLYALVLREFPLGPVNPQRLAMACVGVADRLYRIAETAAKQDEEEKRKK